MRAHLFVAKLHILLAYDLHCGAPENPGHIVMTDPAPQNCPSHSAIMSVKVILSTCVTIWDRGTLIGKKVGAFAGISLKFGHTSDPYPRVLETETQLRYSWLSCSFRSQAFPGLWLKFWHNWDLPSSPEWGSWICVKPTLTSCDSLWMYHSSLGMPQERQIRHWSACIPVCNAHHILVCFFLIMFYSTLNQWTAWTQIVIYRHTSCLGAGSSSRSASANV